MAQRVTLDIQVSDNKAVEKKIKIKSFYDNRFRAKEESDNIVASMRSQGYLLAEMDSLGCDSLHCKAIMHSGEKYKWAKLKKGNADDDLLAYSGFHEQLYANATFTPAQLSRLMERMLVYCENNGYPFARVRLDSVQVNGSEISASLFVAKHKLVKIDSLLIVGNASIHKSFLYRYLHIKPGDLYNEKQILQAEQRIRQLPFVTQKKQQVVKITDKSTKLLLFLDKKNASQFDGILGLQPQPSGKTVLTGNARIRLYNSIFRGGELFDLNWQRLQYQTQDFKTNIVYPYIFNLPIGVDYSLYLYKKDTTFLQVQNNIGLQYLFNGLNYFKVFFKDQSSNLLSTAAVSTSGSLPAYANINTATYGAGIYYEKLDYKFNPRSGLITSFTAGSGSRKIHKDARLNDALYNNITLNSTQYQLDYNVAAFIPLFKYSTIRIASQGGTLNSPQLFTNELYRIGGFRSIRGIDEQSIYASSYAIGTVEYRFLFEQNSALLLFADGAYYENHSVGRHISDTPYSIGAGIMFETKAGIFQLNYAIGHQFNNPFDVRTGKINFGIVNTF